MQYAKKLGVVAVVLAIMAAGMVLWRNLPRSFHEIDVCARLDQCGEVLLRWEGGPDGMEKEIVLNREAVQPLLDTLESGKAQYQGKLKHYGVPSYTLTLDPSVKDNHDSDMVLDAESGALYVLSRDGRTFEYWRLSGLDSEVVAARLDDLLG